MKIFIVSFLVFERKVNRTLEVTTEQLKGSVWKPCTSLCCDYHGTAPIPCVEGKDFDGVEGSMCKKVISR